MTESPYERFSGTTCVGTCARITKVAQYSSIRPPLLWTLPAVLAGPRENARTQGPHVGPLLQSRKSPLRVFSSRYLLAPRSSSFHRGGSNKSTGFYSCLSDILYSAGPGVSPRASPSSSFALSLPPSSRAYVRARAIHYKRR